MKTVTKRAMRIKAGEMMKKMWADGGFGSVGRYVLIQQLVPLGLLAAEEAMEAERDRLVGPAYSRGGATVRGGWDPGSIYLGDQKVAVRRLRVRNRQTNAEVPLESYERLQNQGLIDEAVLKRVLKGLSQRSYEETAQKIPSTFGIKKSAISRRFVKASGKKLREFLERDLSAYEFAAVVIDGKSYAGDQIVVALGVTMEGEKKLLGFTEAKTENYQICKDFLQQLINRGLKTDQEMLFIVDGAKGLRKGIKEVFGDMAFIQRCQWHKRENVLRYLDRNQQDYFRRKLQAAYEQPTYEAVKRRLDAILRELRVLNESAAASLEEGLEDTLTLHRLGVFAKLGISFKTTNCLENVNKCLERHTARVDRWRTSDQRRRWVASALIVIEPRLRRVKGWEFLLTLRDAMHNERIKSQSKVLKNAA